MIDRNLGLALVGFAMGQEIAAVAFAETAVVADQNLNTKNMNYDVQGKKRPPESQHEHTRHT